jgi:hypothetical protein
MTTTAFPSTRDFSELRVRTNEDILTMWRGLMAPHCGCMRHSDTFGSTDAIPTSWLEAVQTELSLRGLSEAVIASEAEMNELTCQTCHAGYSTVCPPEGGPDMYLVCRPCKTMRRLGDHMDCTTGPVIKLPPNW